MKKNRLHIIMPMAGEGSRFKAEGYNTPKPLIKLNNKELYRHSLDSIINFLPTEYILTINIQYTFIIRKEFEYIKDDIYKYYPYANIITVEKTTRGALETVMLAESFIEDDDRVLIMDCDLEFNCQSYINKIYNNVIIDAATPIVMGFYSKDPKYSYVKYIKDDLNQYKLEETAEKIVISNAALAGCYFVGKGDIFKKCAQKLINDFSNNQIKYKEIYVSLIYNYLKNEYIEKLEVILMNLYEDKLWSYGTPEDLENYDYNTCVWDRYKQ